jgi:acyl-CoA dehydrogenase
LRSTQRQTFGKFLWQHGSLQRDIADSFADLNQARLLTLMCAYEMDTKGPQSARQYISSIKVAVPNLCMSVIDRALQVFGGAGVCDDYVIANAWASMRTLRIADGPDEVHRRSVAIKEIKRVQTTEQQKQAPKQSSTMNVFRPPTSRL